MLLTDKGGGVDGDDAEGHVSSRSGAAVETEPGKPEDEDAETGHGEVVAQNGAGLAVLGVLADTGAENDGAGESDGAAHGMHNGGTGEVNEAEVAEPAAGTEQAVPGPVAADGVDDEGDQHADEQVARELHALGDAARNNGGGGSAEHALEEEEREGPHAVVSGGIVAAEAEQVRADDAAQGVTEHEAEAQHEEADGADTEVGEVFHCDVGCVLGAGQTAFDEGEAGLHEHDQHGADHGPDRVNGSLGCVFGGLFSGLGETGNGEHCGQSQQGDDPLSVASEVRREIHDKLLLL